MVDENEQIIVKRKNKAFKLVPVSDDDILVDIPKEYRCNPYEISSSGDVFWADKRNVEKVKKKLLKTKKSLQLLSNLKMILKNFLDTL